MENLSVDEIARNAAGLSVSRLRRQHILAAQFGYFALGEQDFAKILREAVRVAAGGLGARFAKVLRYLPQTDEFLLVEGLGWMPADIGTISMGADDASPAGYAYSSGKPVISNHLGNELRFRTPAILVKYGIERAINVPIRSSMNAYGVLEADSDDTADFTETDIIFMEAVANVIAMALDRDLAQTETRDAGLFSSSVLNASHDCIKVMSVQGELEFMNENGLCHMQIDDFSKFDGLPWTSLWPESARAEIETAIAEAVAGRPFRFEAFCPTTKGEPRWWDVSVSPILGANEQVERIVSVSRDITERHQQEVALSQLLSVREDELRTSELMMKEVHHRVRNSLQLVQTLLGLQANLSADESVKGELKVAARRVLSVASVHERLYREDGGAANDAATYLASLLDDLQAGYEDRPVTLHASSMVLPASRLAPLGLIACELITNSMKYGKGRITVDLERTQDAVKLTVADEGSGFPKDFPKPQGTGLGMRLVKTYAGFGDGSILVDRTVPFSRLIVTFKV
ncbi:PAS domain-containing protein [Robbsia sp. Bb-Pol-6]|uniref:histidine kinase n=1 Tax=Robbsia betulipollinis TaxID=2981849 RepID=A0ABT3ZJT5_9BURK|nr:histidine kinase dimerization/phosphoacceptor domain -containing protein [Robbsia betulipollinis]MCY0386712.1 PAS domain-containing protein [Robbsia betulipollinis]